MTGNCQEGEQHLRNCEVLGTADPYPTGGAFLLEDKFGMTMACSLLLRSLDPKKIQFKTMRKLRLHNFVHTTPGGLGSKLIADDGKGGTVMESPTSLEWFKWFMQGCHRQMDNIWIPD